MGDTCYVIPYLSEPLLPYLQSREDNSTFLKCSGKGPVQER